jgi:dolichol-phosphate mannosyltransferase
VYRTLPCNGNDPAILVLQSGEGSINRPTLKFSVVIPARDEAPSIGPTLDALREHLTRDGIDYELVVVDDGSTDATADQVAERVAVDPRVRLVRNTTAHGFGYAVRCGLDAFTGDAVVVVMADGSDSPDDVVRYFYVLRDRAECAFGSRFLPGSEVVGYPLFKLLLNRMANWCIKLLFGLRYNDVTNAFKGYRANVIEGCRPFLSPHFNLTVEMPLKAIVRGYSYETLPISWRQRRDGASSLKLQEMGSRYVFIVLHVWLEKMLTRGDYRRTDAGKPFRVIAREPGEAPPAVARAT